MILEPGRAPGGVSQRRGGTSFWDVSSVGRAGALQASGRRFEPYTAHHFRRPLAKLVRHRILTPAPMVRIHQGPPFSSQVIAIFR